MQSRSFPTFSLKAIEQLNETPEMVVDFSRDGQSGKITVDDYGARTGKSPGMMRQLNINGALYVGK